MIRHRRIWARLDRLRKKNQELKTQLDLLREKQQEGQKVLAVQKRFILGLLGDVHADLLSTANQLHQQVRRPPGC